MAVVDRIVAHAERLTATERKIAAVLADEPQTVAFGTVAQVASRAGTSGPSVVRLAVKLGYDGFVDLQAEVQSELAEQLGPARDRIRRSPSGDLVENVLLTEHDNLSRTLQGIDRGALERTTARLADARRQVWVLAGTETGPIGTALAAQIGELRPGVSNLRGSEVSVSRSLAGLNSGDTLVTVDIHRYERWLVSVADWARNRGADLVAITDGPLSPLATYAVETFFISARGVGPFDSMAAGMALVNVLVASVSVRLRETATARLDAVEDVWTSSRALVDGRREDAHRMRQGSSNP
jgi:DNA-binding MurR/RpiR family transcriptional regulator